ncbi:MAG: ribosome silencing factor [bacterium]
MAKPQYLGLSHDITTDALAIDMARSVASKKGQGITVLDLRGLTVITDFFIVCNGSSPLNLHAIADAVLGDSKKMGIKGVRQEGAEIDGWVLIDLGGVVIHIFDAENREFYALEKLWVDAPRVPLPADILA